MMSLPAKHTIMQGWPNPIKQVPQVLQPHWTSREELTVEDGFNLERYSNFHTSQAT